MDTKGLPLSVMVTPADMTDRDAAKEILFRPRLMHPEITVAWADSGYAGQLVTWAKKHLDLTLKTVNRPPNTPGFVILPRRWVVERSLVWIMHARRHARDYERLIQHSESLITWAAITLMTSRTPAGSPAGQGSPHPARATGTDGRPDHRHPALTAFPVPQLSNGRQKPKPEAFSLQGPVAW